MNKDEVRALQNALAVRIAGLLNDEGLGRDIERLIAPREASEVLIWSLPAGYTPTPEVLIDGLAPGLLIVVKVEVD